MRVLRRSMVVTRSVTVQRAADVEVVVAQGLLDVFITDHMVVYVKNNLSVCVRVSGHKQFSTAL